MRTIHILATVATVTCFSVSQALAKRVTVEFEAEAGTVTGQPFGMTVPRLTLVRGYFSYETNTPDTFSNSADTMRGSFILAGTWDFRAEFLDRVIMGSGTATSSTNLFGSPTLRFEDGLGNNRPELMTIDGSPDATIGLGFAISGQAKDLPTDQLPENFTFNPPPGGAPHTFSLYSNSGTPATTGTMLLQFRSFRQVEFNPEIEVQQPIGNDLADGVGRRKFGDVLFSTTGRAKKFVLKNSGNAPLENLAITLNGKNPSDFIAGPLGVTQLAPGKSMEFTVKFKPSGFGTRNASLRIRSNDQNENPFDIKLTGNGVGLE